MLIRSYFRFAGAFFLELTRMAAKREGEVDDLALVSKRQRTDGGSLVPVRSPASQAGNQLSTTVEVILFSIVT